MDKVYSGGFLYNPQTGQVLLHKRDSNTTIHPNQWAFFGGTNEPNETPIQNFVRELGEEIGVFVKPEDVKELRNYFNIKRGTHRYVFYVESDLKKEQMTLGEGADFELFTLEEAFQLDLTEKTRDDLNYFQERIIYKNR